jgi:hypothetical protein
MERLGYFAVVAVVVASVVFGLDWTPAPMSPMPDVKFTVPVTPAVPPAQVTVTPVPTPLPGPLFEPPTGPAPVAAPSAPPAFSPPPGCNVAACAAAYRSFQAIDCSYQPSNGPRRRCAK